MADFYFEILETIQEPSIIYEGNYGELIAVGFQTKPSDKFFVVIYKEVNLVDGFVITAYLSNKKQSFKKKKILWKHR